MCGRFDETMSLQELAERFAATYDELSFEPRFNIAPTQDVPCVVEGDRGPQIKLFKWGFVPHWAKDPKIGHKMINARAETVAEKPSFRQSFQQRRCLVPATGFFEWKREGTAKQPFRITRRDGAPFAMAGLWDEWVDRHSGEILHSFTIITTRANEQVRDLHDRMPVILQRKDERIWIDANVTDAPCLQNLLKPYAPPDLLCYPVSPRVNSPRNDSPDLVERVESNS